MFEILGNIGDFLGGIGVVVTLIYLATQIRQNTTSNLTASYQAAVSSISDLSRAIGLDPQACSIMARGSTDRDGLPPDDRRQFDLLMTAMFRNFENIHFQYDNGAISDEVWTGWAARIASNVAPPGARDWWQDHAPAYSLPFRRFIDSNSPSEQPADIFRS